MSRVKCLAILCLSNTAPTARPISAAPRSGWRLRATAAAMRASSRSVAASSSSRLRVRSTASARLRQTIRRSQCRDPVEPGLGEVLADARLGDHAAVTDQHHVVESKAFLELGDLAGQRHRIRGAAFKDLDRHRTAVRGTEQTVDDLPFAALAVAVVAILSQWAAPPFHVARRDVVEHQGAAGEVASGERPLDCRLANRQPVQCGVELVLINDAKAELLAEAGAGGLRRQRAGGGELGTGLEQAADDKGQHQIATTVAVGAEQTIEADLARRAEGSGDMPMRQRADDGDGLLVLRDDGAVFEQHLEARDAVCWPIGRLSRVRFLTLPPSR